jgi:hypothetical protein
MRSEVEMISSRPLENISVVLLLQRQPRSWKRKRRRPPRSEKIKRRLLARREKRKRRQPLFQWRRLRKV